MKIKLANYIADFLVQKGITDIFTVTGGGAMHLNDALGHHEKLKCIYITSFPYMLSHVSWLLTINY